MKKNIKIAVLVIFSIFFIVSFGLLLKALFGIAPRPSEYAKDITKIDLDDFTSDVIITNGGKYVLVGSLIDYSVIIKTSDDVTIQLNNVTINSTKGPAIYNQSSSNLTIDAIATTSSSLSVSSEEQEGVIVSNGNVSIIGNGTINITSVQKETNSINIIKGGLKLEKANLLIKTYSKGIIATTDVEINSGKLYVESEDETIQTNKNVIINGGKVFLTSRNLGLSADQGLIINGGKFVSTSNRYYACALEESKQKVVCVNYEKQLEPKASCALKIDDVPLIIYETNYLHQYVIMSSPELDLGNYSLYIYGFPRGAISNGFYETLTYDGGSIQKLNGSNIITIDKTINNY